MQALKIFFINIYQYCFKDSDEFVNEKKPSSKVKNHNFIELKEYFKLLFPYICSILYLCNMHLQIIVILAAQDQQIAANIPLHPLYIYLHIINILAEQGRTATAAACEYTAASTI